MVEIITGAWWWRPIPSGWNDGVAAVVAYKIPVPLLPPPHHSIYPTGIGCLHQLKLQIRRVYLYNTVCQIESVNGPFGKKIQNFFTESS